MNEKKFDIPACRQGREERLIDFAVAIIFFVERLPYTKSVTHLGEQLLRLVTFPSFYCSNVRLFKIGMDKLRKIDLPQFIKKLQN
ncbi:MAG: hypothetical protein KAT68_11950 [Bacteroidales bacterium]|nr:hypothetical protein [Bacteroidales bacterium]